MSYINLKEKFSDVCESVELNNDHIGWFPIVKTVLETARRENIHISLIKEKFGDLRVCCHTSNDKFSTASSFACSLSGNTCSKCGKYGQLYSKDGWYVTGCETCFPGWSIEKTI